MPNLYEDDNGPVVIPRPPASQKYNPGPPPRASMAGTRNTAAGHPSPPPKPAPDMFANYPGPETDAAKQLVQQFMTLMGYPQGVDLNQLMLQLLQNNLLGDSQAAAQYLYINGKGINQGMRDASPWAQFGIDAGTYHSRKDSIDATFQGLIGQDPEQLTAGWGDDLHQLYYNALKNNWSQSELMSKLQNDPKFASLRASQPWLASGQTEAQAAQQFTSLYGSAPVGTDALAGWFRFNTGANQLSRTSREAIMTAAPQASTSEAR